MQEAGAMRYEFFKLLPIIFGLFLDFVKLFFEKKKLTSRSIGEKKHYFSFRYLYLYTYLTRTILQRYQTILTFQNLIRTSSASTCSYFRWKVPWNFHEKQSSNFDVNLMMIVPVQEHSDFSTNEAWFEKNLHG